jgi:hypothetical protein
VTARLPLAMRNGILAETQAWFTRCMGVPGNAIAPQLHQDLVFTGGVDGESFQWRSLAQSVISTAQRTPYEPIGDYMERWWFLPEIYGERARVHRTLRSDNARDAHDHPFHFVTVILENGYTEEIETVHGMERRRYRAGDVLFRHAEHRHRLEIEPGMDCWSLVFTSPIVREWGFWTPAGFVPWADYEHLERA